MTIPSVNTIDINTFRAPFIQTYEGSINGLWFNDVAKKYPTASLIGVYPGLASAVGLKAWTGNRQLQKALPFKLTVTSAPLEGSATYPVDNFKVDQLGIFQDNINELAVKASYHYNNAVRDFLVAATGLPSFDSGYDGSTVVNYFSTGHPYGFDMTGANPTGTQSNLITSNAAGTSGLASLAVVSKLAPTVAEASKIVMDLTAQFLGMFDLNGDQINGSARSFYIFVGDQAKYTAFQQAVKSLTIVANTGGGIAENPLVGFKGDGFSYRVIYDPVLTGDSIYMLRADGSVKPVLIQETSGIEIQTLGPDSEYAITTNYVVFGVKQVSAISGLLYTSALKATLINHS